MYLRSSHWLWLIGLFCVQIPSIAFAFTEYAEVENLRYRWSVYSEEEEKYKPYRDQEEAEILFFSIDSLGGGQLKLRLDLHSHLYVFIGNRLALYSERGNKYLLDVDSLYDFYGRLDFSIYGKSLDPDKISSLLLKVSKRKLNRKDKILLSDFRESFDVRDYLIVISIIMMGLLLVYRTSGFKLFNEYLSIADALSVRQRFEAISSQSIFSSANISYVLLYAAFVSGGVYGLMISDTAGSMDSFFGLSVPAAYLSAGVFVLSVILMILRLPLIFMAALLFQITKVYETQFFIYLRLSLIFSILFFACVMLNGIMPGQLLFTYSEFMKALVVVALFGRIVIVFMALNSQLNFYKLHLFAYLCSTEIIPLIVFLKFLLK